jgi:hypothetical protein
MRLHANAPQPTSVTTPTGFPVNATEATDDRPPPSDIVREGQFLKAALPSGRWLTITLRWYRHDKTWAFDPPPSTWTWLDRVWVLERIRPLAIAKLNYCYDKIEPGWVRKRAAAVPHPAYQTVTVPPLPERVERPQPLSPIQLRQMVGPRP